MAYTFDKANANARQSARRSTSRRRQSRYLPRRRLLAATTPPAGAVADGRRNAQRGQRLQMVAVHHRGLLQKDDLAAKMPDKLRNMQELFLVEATKNSYFPLDNSVLQRALTPATERHRRRTVFTYSGEVSGIPEEVPPAPSASPGPSRPRWTFRKAVPKGSPDERRPLRRWPLLGQGQAGLYLCPTRQPSASAGKARLHSRRASTPSCLTSR